MRTEIGSSFPKISDNEKNWKWFGYFGEVMLTEFPSLPPLFKESPNVVHEMTLASDIYEHAVVLSVKCEDQDAFESDFFQLKQYYTDTCGIIPPSLQEYPILGLDLLRLLVQNQIAEFHTELELLSASALENPCIKHAVELEQSFMEGAYKRVLSAKQIVPHEIYVYFMDLLAKTVRDEIAGCSEKAYDYFSINEAKQILMFSSYQELSGASGVGDKEWVCVLPEGKGDCTLQGDIVTAAYQSDAKLCKRVGANSLKLLELFS